MFRQLIEDIRQVLAEDDEAYLGTLKIGEKPKDGESGYGGHRIAPPVPPRAKKMGPPPIPGKKKGPPPMPQKKPLNPWGGSDEQ